MDFESHITSLVQQAQQQIDPDRQELKDTLRRLIKSQDFEALMLEINTIVDQYFASVSEVSILRLELLEARRDLPSLQEECNKFRRIAITYQAKYDKTKKQNQELLSFYQKEKAYQHSNKMIQATNEYLSVLASQVDHEKSKIAYNSKMYSSTVSQVDYNTTNQVSNALRQQIKSQAESIQRLQVQCSMQEKLIQLKAKHQTYVQAVLQPGQGQFQILEDEELGLAKQLVVGDLICFVDCVKPVVELGKLFAIDTEELVLGPNTDALVINIGEPLHQERQCQTAIQLVARLRQFQEIRIEQRQSQLQNNQYQISPKQPFGGLSEPQVDYTVPSCVQWRLQKKIMLDKYDTSYITMFYFPDLQSYEKHLKVAKRLSVVRYNDLWPASQIQYFNQNSQPVYCSLLLHIRDGDQLQAETLLRYFKLN